MKSRKTKCRWCGKLATITKSGYIGSHVVSSRIKCIGIGRPITPLDIHFARFDSSEIERRKINSNPPKPPYNRGFREP